MEEWALITGASAGIGRELAEVFAEHHFNLLLVARNEARLDQLAAALKTKHRTQAKVMPQDLARPNAAAELFRATSDTPVSVLVNNAGFGAFGEFAELPLELQTEIMHVNMTALVELTHWFVQPMLKRRSGRILNVASTAAFQPGPGMNIYYASKAFVFSFSYALAEELRGSGVTVTALCPGLTRSEFLERAQLRPRPGWPMMEPRVVAEAGYRALMKGKRVVIPGLLNKITSALARRAPARLTTAVVRMLNSKDDRI